MEVNDIPTNAPFSCSSSATGAAQVQLLVHFRSILGPFQVQFRSIHLGESSPPRRAFLWV